MAGAYQCCARIHLTDSSGNSWVVAHCDVLWSLTYPPHSPVLSPVGWGGGLAYNWLVLSAVRGSARGESESRVMTVLRPLTIDRTTVPITVCSQLNWSGFETWSGFGGTYLLRPRSRASHGTGSTHLLHAGARPVR